MNVNILIVDGFHKGDDVASTVVNWVSAVMMNIGMRVCGHVGNDDKILIDEGCTEFLRNITLPDGTVRGYLNRSIPNLISKDT